MGYTSITTNYAGDDIGDILELIILGNEAIDKGMFHVYTDVQKQREITKGYVAGNLIGPYQAYPTTPSGALSFVNNLLVPFKMTVFDLFNPIDFQSYWQEYQPEGPLAEKVLDPDIMKVIVGLYTKKIDNELGGLIWQGDVAGTTFTTWNGHTLTGKFNGIVTKAIADAAVVKPTANGALTQANIVTQLTNMDALMPDSVYREPAYFFHMSTASARLYLNYIIQNQTYKGPGVSDLGPGAITNDSKNGTDTRFPEAYVGNGSTLDTLSFNGRSIKNYTGFPNNYILAAKGSTNPMETHLFVGVNAENDPENLIIQKWRPEADLWFLKANFSMDVNYSFSEEMILYKPS
jgi:hypothetical protein